MSEQDSALGKALNELLPAVEIADDWGRVLRDADAGRLGYARVHQALTPRLRLVLVATVLLLAALIPLTALGVSNSWWLRDSGRRPPAPIGEAIVLRTGKSNAISWSLIGYRTVQNRMCLVFTTTQPQIQNGPPPSPPATYCDANVVGMADQASTKPPGLLAFFGSVAPEDAGNFVAGPTSAQVAHVKILLSDGGAFIVDTAPVPDELGQPIRFFVAVVPERDAVSEIDALSGSGEVLDHTTVRNNAATTHPGGGVESGYDFAYGS
jgi:hypothetical protein